VQEADAGISDPDLKWSDVDDGGGPAVTPLGETTLADGSVRYRSGVGVPAGVTGDVRFLYEELDGAVVDYSDTIEIPSTWL
jgi:hypothetical protein